jgi:hypothetical protein
MGRRGTSALDSALPLAAFLPLSSTDASNLTGDDRGEEQKQNPELRFLSDSSQFILSDIARTAPSHLPRSTGEEQKRRGEEETTGREQNGGRG